MADAINNAYSWAAITPSDTATIEPRPVGVWVGGAGNVAAVGEDGNDEVFAATAGSVLPIQPIKILSTGTTATGLIALYN